MNSSVTARKFKDAQFYSGQSDTYQILPFNFIRLRSDREVLVSFAGDFLIVPNGTASRIATYQITSSEEIYKDLLANFIIYHDDSTLDLVATRYRTKMAFLDEFTSLHIFVVTLRCNHTCHYCQVSRVTENKSQFDIKTQDLDRAILHMFRSTARAITMEFQGGEPLLAFDKVRYAVEHAIELNVQYKKRITFVICTNATVCSQEILSFCKEHKILISTSLDGPAFIHDANRKKSGNNSYAEVIKGIDQFRQHLGHDQVSALMTASTISLNYPVEIIDSYVENGFNSIFLRPISPYGFALYNVDKNDYKSERFLEFYKRGLAHILSINRKGIHFVEDSTVIALRKMMTPFPIGYVDLQSPAGLVNSVVVYNYDGYVYASDEARMLAENKDYTFRLGHVNDEYSNLFFGPIVQEIADHSCNQSLAGCADCALQLYCGADPVFHHATQRDWDGYRPASGYCKKNMGIITHILELLDTNPDVAKVFTNWIGTR